MSTPTTPPPSSALFADDLSKDIALRSRYGIGGIKIAHINCNTSYSQIRAHIFAARRGP